MIKKFSFPTKNKNAPNSPLPEVVLVFERHPAHVLYQINKQYLADWIAQTARQETVDVKVAGSRLKFFYYNYFFPVIDKNILFLPFFRQFGVFIII